MLASTLLFAAFAAAAPMSDHVHKRAGGPIAKPIPSTCTVTNPLPTSSGAETYQPAPATSDALLYSAYYPSPSSNKTALAEQCLQQCYGYGDSTQCKTVYWAENVVTPAGYRGSPGGALQTGCVFFNRTLVNADFVPAPAGQATDAFAGNIQC
ncbi:hypothetical protein BDV95DRAFT_589993 [Massariosphaeria phaeospora]|uniref:Uncharacterized protein n=1 Tax=Massariosphaeria phaeospora TaxID=100035 RepID=A0A7C8MMZ3_9PLEO|nr:hypothetical protein BDV95DRAFT_589993 [Massariosphaeria phaeospora]